MRLRVRAHSRYRDDGRIKIDNSAAEGTLRAAAMGRRNYLSLRRFRSRWRTRRRLLFPHRHRQAQREGYLRQLLGCINDHPIHRIEKLCCLGKLQRTATRNRGVSKNTVEKGPLAELLPSLAAFIDEGEITFCILEPVGRVATAADGHNWLAMLVRRRDEKLTQLLTRLDYTIGLALTEDIFTDEVNG